jgi:penicillin-binding protein 2
MIDRDSDRIKMFTRRAFIIGGFQVCLFGALGSRLAWLQIAQSGKYKTLSDDNRINLKILPPSRGIITDRNGILLAENGQNFRAVVVPEQTESLEKALQRLGKIIAITPDDIKRVLKLAKKSPSFLELEVKDNLVWEDVARVEVNLPDLPGVSIDVGDVRHYPLGEPTAHLIGYVGAVAKGEQSDDPLLTMPDFKIGKSGLEKAFDQRLRGSAGTAEIEVNVVGREVQEVARKEGKSGERLKLTIDAELQLYTQDRLAVERSASAVVMDAQTGAVYALASYPAFDPNVFSRGISAELWEKLLADPSLPLTNKAVSGQYPPGSTFKMVTAMAALEAGVINEHTTAFCPGHFQFGKIRFHCWKKEGHGTVDVRTALEQSCDTFFYTLASNLGIDRLEAMARKLGLGDKLGIGLDEERPGFVPSKRWKATREDKVWHPGETVNAVIGQGYMLTTPLQLATMTARLVNGGRAVKPYLTGVIGNESGAPAVEWESLNFKKKHLDIVRQGMERVVTSQRGTAYGSRILEEGMAMGGKTGTAQVKRITMDERNRGVKNENLPWKFRHHALFVGYAPIEAPRYVCSVVVEHGVGGSKAAAPMAHDLLLKVQQLNPADKPIGLDDNTTHLAPFKTVPEGFKKVVVDEDEEVTAEAEIER